MNNFYYFDSPYLSSSFCVAAIGLEHDNGDYDQDKLIESKYEGINFPVVFKQTGGKKFTDILNTGWVSMFLISDNLEKLLKDNLITGWRTYPIILKDKKENQIEGYHGFSITGVSGGISYANSKIIETRYVPEGPIIRKYIGADIDLSKWNGGDFFIPEGTKGIVITKKVAELLEKNKISNLYLENIAESEIDAYIVESIDKRRIKKDSSL